MDIVLEGRKGLSDDEPISEPWFEEYLFMGVPLKRVKGSEDICEFPPSFSHKGMTLKAGMPGGIDEAGDVSLDLELSIHESDSFELPWCL